MKIKSFDLQFNPSLYNEMPPLCTVRIIEQNFISLVSVWLKRNIVTAGLISKAILMLSPIKDPRVGLPLWKLEDSETWLWTICYLWDAREIIISLITSLLSDKWASDNFQWEKLYNHLALCRTLMKTHSLFNHSTIATASISLLLLFELIGKDPTAGKDWGQKEKGVTEDETVGWHHQLNGHEFERTLGDSGGQKRLACCSPWGHKESDTILWPNNNNYSNMDGAGLRGGGRLSLSF